MDTKGTQVGSQGTDGGESAERTGTSRAHTLIYCPHCNIDGVPMEHDCPEPVAKAEGGRQ